MKSRLDLHHLWCVQAREGGRGEGDEPSSARTLRWEGDPRHSTVMARCRFSLYKPSSMKSISVSAL